MSPSGPFSQYDTAATGIGGQPSASAPLTSQQHFGHISTAITAPVSQQQPPSQWLASPAALISVPHMHHPEARGPIPTTQSIGLSMPTRPTRSTPGNNDSSIAGLLDKMSSISLMPPPSPPGAGLDAHSNVFKNDLPMSTSSSSPHPTMDGSVGGGAIQSGPPGREGVGIGDGGMEGGRPRQQPGGLGIASLLEEDWASYQGPHAAESQLNVLLQSSLTFDSVVCCVRYSWDGQFLAIGSNRAAHIFNAATGHHSGTFYMDSTSSCDGGATANRIDSDGRCGNDSSGSGDETDSYVRSVCFSPDGQWLITGGEDNVVKVWDVNTHKVKHLLMDHGSNIFSVDAAPNGQFIVSGSEDKRAKLWCLESGELLTTFGHEEHEYQRPSDGITSVAVSPTNLHVVAGSLDNIVRVWEVETGTLVRQFEGHRGSVYSVAFSPDGRWVLSGSLDKSLKLWDLASPQHGSNQPELTFSGHKDFVLSVAFSPDCRWLISGSKDRSVQFWDPRQSEMCLMLHGHKNSVISIAHNPGSKWLATGSGDCRARSWVYS